MTAWAPKYLHPVTAVLLLVFALWFHQRLATYPQRKEINIDGRRFSVEIADTPYEKQQGLSGRSGLAAHKAMLFVLGNRESGCIWMKDMKFAIDVFWFDQDGKLIHLVRSMDPSSFPAMYCPPTQAASVVETASGTADSIGAELGRTKLHNLAF